MTFYNEDHTIAQQYQVQREREKLLEILVPEQTRVRITAYARTGRASIGVYREYHPGKDFPFEISINGMSDFFDVGQFAVISGGKEDA